MTPGPSEASQSNVGFRAARPSGTYKRTYKACESCRKTKAKCERDENSEACFKCQREQRECIFPAHRSTKRAKLAHAAPSPAVDASQDGTEVARLGHGGNAWQQHQQNQQLAPSPSRSSHLVDLSPRGDNPLAQRPLVSGNDGANRSKQAVPAHTAHSESTSLTDNLQDQVVQTVVASSSDAVGLLFRAAGSSDSESLDDSENHGGIETGPAQSMSTGILSPSLNTREHVPPDILELWSQHRFVRQGWFTAREAVAYVLAFFTKLSPLSPVMDGFNADPASHRRLILEEPLLCCTVLMVSSRHHYPSGPGGAVRADFIHARLWRHIEHLVQRITFGSEKYSMAKSRTLGSIQALLLITEWHPRSLHFPPENDGWDASLAPTVDDSFTPQDDNSEASKRWREDVFEPAKRSDRLSWMLVGMATTLAHELGIFRPTDDMDIVESSAVRSSKLRIRRLLYLYATQLSLRLGCTSIFPQDALQDIAQPPAAEMTTMSQVHRDGELMLSKWIDITRLMTTVADMFFANRSTTKQILRSTRYVNLLNHFQPMLDSWYNSYLQMPCPTIQGPARKILLVDYYYARVYIHSIAIQALVDRITNLSGGDEMWQDHEIWRSKHAQDFASVNEVRESSCKILMTAVELSDEGILQYCPVRVYLRIVSASVFLLKAISLGSREADISSSLKTLDRCIVALRTNRADDIHLSSRYAILISRHVQRFRRNFRVKKKALLPTPHRSRVASPFRAGTLIGQHNDNDQQEPRNQDVSSSAHTRNDDQEGNRESFPGTVTGSTDQFDFDENGMLEEWLAQPFDPQIAPFGLDYMQAGAGIAVDSLDFLWNIPNQTQQ
ncbi:Transcription factor hmgR [Exophiala dermatitidis]